MTHEHRTYEHTIHGKLVQISSVEGFYDWLRGQTCPIVEGNETPFDWAYYSDYARFINNLPVID